jgi:hypothetical protein
MGPLFAAQWFGGLIIGAGGHGFAVDVCHASEARLPATFAPVRFGEPLVFAGSGDVGRQTEELVRTLLWVRTVPLAWVTTGLLIVSTVICLFRSGRRGLYFSGGLLLAYLMAGIGFLVYWHRYVWYAFPLEVLLICGGTFMLASGHYRRYLMPIAYVALSVLAVVLFTRLPAISGHPFQETEQFGQVLQYLQPRYQNGDVIYVYYGTRPAFTRYGTEALLKAAVLQEWSRGVAPEAGR